MAENVFQIPYEGYCFLTPGEEILTSHAETAERQFEK
jgi:hypothetical protein